jgi:transmembrane sensor
MPPEINRIDAEAAAWAVRLSRGSLSNGQQAELDAWLKADTRHRGALVRSSAAWIDLDRLAALAGRTRQADSWSRLAQGIGPSPSRRWFLAAGLATTAVAGGGGGWWYLSQRGQVYVSDVGEVRRVTLADGSSMLLNTATRAVVHFKAQLREVELIRGEGLFEVAKEVTRPFIVRAGGVSVRAVGTVFAVRALSEDVDVTVTEGVVEVADTDLPGSAARQRVSADQRAVVTPRQGIKVQAVSAAQAERRLAWRDGMLAFDGEPLFEAVAEINRHNLRKIKIDDPRLGERPVVGIFRASDEEGFARAVAAALNAESSEGDDTIHLRGRNR